MSRAFDVWSAVSGSTDGDHDHVDHSPGRTSIVLAIGLATLATVVLPEPVSLFLGVPGTLLVAVGAIVGSRRTVGYGMASFAVAILIAGVSGVQPISLVLCTLLSVLAWDAGRYGITVGEQLGREAETTRIELAHTALNATVGIAGVSLGYASYLFASGTDSVAALALLLFGGIVLFATLR